MKNVIMLSCLMLLCGCIAGGNCVVTARSVPEPVSCSPSVFDVDGTIRAANPDEVERHIKLTDKKWTMFWTFLPLNGREWDLSEEIKGHLKETSGNAVVNLTVKSTSCNWFHGFIGAFVPIVPTYVKVDVEADVVRMAGP